VSEPPRTTSGNRYHRLGDAAHAVVLDGDGQEVSERHGGQLWIALAPGDVDLIFHDDNGGSGSSFMTTLGATNPRVGVFVDGDLIHEMPLHGYVAKGCCVTVDWTPMYERMA